MSGRRKVFVLAILSSIVASAVMVAPASAEEEEFTAAEYPATVTGTGPQEFVFGVHKVKCGFALLLGVLKSNSKSKTQTGQAFAECKATVLGKELPAQVAMNGCDWIYPDASQPKKDLFCPDKKEVVIVVYESKEAEEAEEATCTYHLEGQEELSTVEFQNTTESSPEDVLAIDELSGIVYTTTGSVLICGSSGSSGEFNAETTSVATNEEEEEIAYMVG